MAVVGLFGDVLFTTSTGRVLTPQTVQRDSSAKWSKHDRHLQKSMVEFTGLDAETATLKIKLSAMLGVVPEREYDKLHRMMQEGRAEWLVLGGKIFGQNKWVITKLSEKPTVFYTDGAFVSVDVSVSLLEYVQN